MGALARATIAACRKGGLAGLILSCPPRWDDGTGEWELVDDGSKSIEAQPQVVDAPGRLFIFVFDVSIKDVFRYKSIFGPLFMPGT